ncbi:hypothetical protein GGF43_001625, partial [Coemansia sp. RSA 2618]
VIAPAIESRHLRWDHNETNVSKYFDECFAYIDEARTQHGGVLVHCQLGVSRSASLVIAYVMRTMRVGLDAAYEYVRLRAPCISPNISLVSQLSEYSRALGSELVISTRVEKAGGVPELSSASSENSSSDGSSVDCMCRRAVPHMPVLATAKPAVPRGDDAMSIHVVAHRHALGMDVLELRLSACLDVSAVSALLASESTVPVSHVIASVPECVDGAQLARLLFPEPPVGLMSASIAEACVCRAEAIDRWTGRLDWALEWLRSLPAHPHILACMHNARILDRVLTVSGRQPWSLAEMNGMSDQERMSSVLDVVAAGDGRLACSVFEMLLLLLLDAGDHQDNSEGRDEWNAWWAQNMAACDEAVVRAAVENCAAWFSDGVLLCMVYGIGPCTQSEDAELVLRALAANHGISSCVRSSSIDMPERVHAAVRSGDYEALKLQQQQLSYDEALLTCEAGLAQAHACRTAARAGADVDVPAIAQCQGSEQTQRRLLARILRAPSPPLLAMLGELRELCVFALVEHREIQTLLLHALLCAEQFADAREMLEAAGPEFTDSAEVRDTVCAAARELVDNAESGNKERGLLRSALECLGIVSARWQHDARVGGERQLIEAAHLAWQLGAHQGALRVFQSNGETRVLPIEIRLVSDDPFDVLRLVLQRYPDAYKRPRLVRELGASLVLLKTHTHVEMSVRDLSVRSVFEAFVVGLMLEASVKQGDAGAACAFVRQLMAALREVFAPCMRKVEVKRAKRMMLGAADADRLDVDERVVDLVWTACVDLIKRSAGAVAESGADPVSLALSLCPPDQVPSLLRLSADAQAAVAGSGDWQDPWSSMLAPTDVLKGVREMLIGELTREDPPRRADERVDPESMRTFDPAILRRCLRASRSDPSARRALLMEWLDFAMTTAKEPRDARAHEFRASMEAELVQRFPAEAAEQLHARVLPQLDQTNITQVQVFYAMYARCVEATGDVERAEQARARARLADAVAGVPALHNLRFDEVAGAMAGYAASRDASVDMLGALLAGGGADVEELIKVAPELVCVAGKSGSVKGGGGDDDAGALLVSGLRAWRLHRLLDYAAATGQTAQLLGALSDNADKLEPDDTVAVANRIAYDPQLAQSVDAGTRMLALQKCPEQLQQVERARAFVQFAIEVRGLRDPFTFARISDEWARAFDAGGRVDAQASSSSDVAAQCFGVLVEMGQTEPAYFVCQAYMCVSRLLHEWRLEPAVLFSLASVYSAALARVLASDNGDVLRVCEPPLELCEFDYGDSELGTVLRGFWDEFGGELERVVGDVGVNSAARLQVLDVVRRFRRVDDMAAAAAELRLLADLHWAHAVDVADSVEARCSEWQQLLDMTGPDHAHVDAQCAALVRLLDSWSGECDSSVDECWVRMLGWAVDHDRVSAVVAPMTRAADRLQRLGSRVFPPRVECVQEGNHPDLVCPLAELALLFPDPSWAEPCMELVVHAVSAPNHIAAEEEEEEEGSAWDTGDVPETPIRDRILSSAYLHFGIIIRGFVSACANCELLPALRCTLMDRGVQQSAEFHEVLSFYVPNAKSPVLALLLKTVHTLEEIGMQERAVEWVYECLQVPRGLRYYSVRGSVAGMWIRQLDAVIRGAVEMDGGDGLDKAGRDDLQLPLAGEDTEREDIIESKDIADKGRVEEEGDEEHAWGGDADIDLDFDLDDDLDARVPEVSAEPLITKASTTEPVSHTEDVEDAWGDDDDIDLDADLENII